jgi:hypothetical protein
MNESRTIVKLEDDPRWKRLHDKSWICSTCGMAHGGIFDLACRKPAYWQGSEAIEPNSIVATSTNFLSEDFCVVNNEHFFIRCILQVPIQRTENCFFAYGVWSTLSKANFAKYAETFDAGNQVALGPWFGWFSNRLKGYPETLNLKCNIRVLTASGPILNLSPPIIRSPWNNGTELRSTGC